MSSRPVVSVPAAPTKESVYDDAREVFGDPSKTFSWLNTPNPFFKGLCPKDFVECGNAQDLELVIEELARIDQGLF
jgi:uncharacterized protein (DUF2384 family)